MQGGDLEAVAQERIMIVIEGVLCSVRPIEQEVGRWRKAHRIVGYHINWYDVPLKRVMAIHDRFSQFSIELVTFLPGEFLEEAVGYLRDMGIPFDTALNIAFERFAFGLKYQQDVRAIYDSDPDRLDRYGQLGVAVVAGMDF